MSNKFGDFAGILVVFRSELLAKEKVYLEDEIRSEMNFSEIVGNDWGTRARWERMHD
jgi:hypothetical protein